MTARVTALIVAIASTFSAEPSIASSQAQSTVQSPATKAAVAEINNLHHQAIELQEDGRIGDAIHLLDGLTGRFNDSHDPAIEGALAEATSAKFTMLVRVGDYSEASRLVDVMIDRAIAAGKSFSQEELADARAVAKPERWQASDVEVSRQPGAIGVVFFGFHPPMADKDRQAADEWDRKVSSEGDLFMRWTEFREHIGQYVKAAVIRNDYPQYDLAAGISCLVQHDPHYWGITWNGGIMMADTGPGAEKEVKWITQRYEAYRRDPTKYRPVSDPVADPVNPGKYLSQWRCLPTRKQ